MLHCGPGSRLSAVTMLHGVLKDMVTIFWTLIAHGTMLHNSCIPHEQLVATIASWPAGADNPVAGPLLRHLTLHCATSRITSALTVTAWLHALQQGSRPQPTTAPDPPSGSPPSPSAVPPDIVQALFGCLAQPAVVVTAEGAIQPYAELTTVYSAMQTQAQVLNMLLLHVQKCIKQDTWHCFALCSTKPYPLYCSHMVARLSAMVMSCLIAHAHTIIILHTNNCFCTHSCFS